MMSTSTQTIHNFSAGPCILPQSVMQQASDAVRELDGSGLSLVEISHRSKAFVDVMEEARSLVRSELNLPDHYEVLFLQGGASLGFLTTAMNFTPDGSSKLRAQLAPGTLSRTVEAVRARYSALWQERSQLKKELRGQVRRLVKPLDLDGWAKEVPLAVEAYAVQHYRKD